METEQNESESSVQRIPDKEIEVREFRREDTAQLSTLFKSCLGRSMSAEYLDWKFFGGPYNKKLAFLVAEHEGRIVAFIGANPVPFAIDGELSLVYQHQDVAIAEEARSLRLLRRMSEGCEEQFKGPSVLLTYSITTPHLRALVTKRMKYTVVWEDLKIVKMISLRGMVSKATRSAALASYLPGPITRSFKVPSSLTGQVEAVDHFGPEFDTFWNEARKPGENGRIFGWGQPDWLNYKFTTDALVPFRCYAYRENGQVLGYLVLNITRLDVLICYIDALWTLPGRSDVAELLLDFARHEATREKCDQIAAWSQLETPMGRAMTKQGYVRRPTSQCFSVKHVSPDQGDRGLKGEHWNLQRGHTYYTSVGHLDTDEGARRLYQAKEQRDQQRAQRLTQQP